MVFEKLFSGRFEFVTESAFGAGAGATPEFKKPSDYIESVAINTEHDRIELRDISGYDVKKVLAALKKYGLEITYVPQRKSTQSEQLFYYHFRDGSTVTGLNGNSLYIEIKINSNNYIKCYGCLSKDMSIKAAQGDVFKITQTFLVREATHSTTETSGTHATEIGTEPYVFGGGGFTRGGSAVAYCVNSIELNIKNNIDGWQDIGNVANSDLVLCAAAGKMEINGTTDLLIDDIAAMLSAVDGATQQNMILALGDAAGDDKITLTNAWYGDLKLEIDTEKPVVKEGVPFGAENATLGTV